MDEERHPRSGQMRSDWLGLRPLHHRHIGVRTKTGISRVVFFW